MGKLRLGHRNQYASVHERRATPSVKLLIAHEFWNLDDTHISSRWTLDVGRSWTFSVRCLAHFGTVLQELRCWLSLLRQVPVELVQLAQREQEPLEPEVKWHTAHGYQRNSKTWMTDSATKCRKWTGEDNWQSWNNVKEENKHAM